MPWSKWSRLDDIYILSILVPRLIMYEPIISIISLFCFHFIYIQLSEYVKDLPNETYIFAFVCTLFSDMYATAGAKSGFFMGGFLKKLLKNTNNAYSKKDFPLFQIEHSAKI